ncbi:MAG: crossover junction endodeoxyribonuclease RuvC [Alphaproteobacteria bacterium]
MRLLGLDPGLRATGWGIIDVRGNHLTFVAAGTIHSAAHQSLAARLSVIYSELIAVIDSYKPDEAAVEETFLNRNPVSTLKLGQARGVVLLAPAQAGLAVAEYAATTIKKAIVGTGHADKIQIQSMVSRLLPGALAHSPDAADALAIAICHAHYAGSAQRTIAALKAEVR